MFSKDRMALQRDLKGVSGVACFYIFLPDGVPVFIFSKRSGLRLTADYGWEFTNSYDCPRAQALPLDSGLSTLEVHERWFLGFQSLARRKPSPWHARPLGTATTHAATGAHRLPLKPSAAWRPWDLRCTAPMLVACICLLSPALRKLALPIA